MAIEGRLVALAAWMKEYYGGTMIQSLKTVLPIKREENKKIRRYVRLLLDEEEGKTKLEEYLKKNQKARARLLAALLDDVRLISLRLAPSSKGVAGLHRSYVSPPLLIRDIKYSINITA